MDVNTTTLERPELSVNTVLHMLHVAGSFISYCEWDGKAELITKGGKQSIPLTKSLMKQLYDGDLLETVYDNGRVNQHYTKYRISEKGRALVGSEKTGFHGYTGEQTETKEDEI